jgi:hypothetical protein
MNLLRWSAHCTSWENNEEIRRPSVPVKIILYTSSLRVCDSLISNHSLQVPPSRHFPLSTAPFYTPSSPAVFFIAPSSYSVADADSFSFPHSMADLPDMILFTSDTLSSQATSEHACSPDAMFDLVEGRIRLSIPY